MSRHKLKTAMARIQATLKLPKRKNDQTTFPFGVDPKSARLLCATLIFLVLLVLVCARVRYKKRSDNPMPNTDESLYSDLDQVEDAEMQHYASDSDTRAKGDKGMSSARPDTDLHMEHNGSLSNTSHRTSGAMDSLYMKNNGDGDFTKHVEKAYRIMAMDQIRADGKHEEGRDITRVHMRHTQSDHRDRLVNSTNESRVRTKREETNTDENSNVPQYLGCKYLSEIPGKQALATPIVTVTNCIYTCWSMGQPLALLTRSHDCFCMDKMTGAVDSIYICNMPCTGNALQLCGSAQSETLSAYSTGLVKMPDEMRMPEKDVAAAAKGCYVHPPFTSPSGVLFRSGRMITSACLVRCGQLRYKFAMLWVGFYCFCDNNLPEKKEEGDSKCQEPCKGENNMKCGGLGHVAAFETNYTGTAEPVYQGDFVYDKWMQIDFQDQFFQNKDLENALNVRRDTILGNAEAGNRTASSKSRRRRQLSLSWNSRELSDPGLDKDLGQAPVRSLNQSVALNEKKEQQQATWNVHVAVILMLILFYPLVLYIIVYKWYSRKIRLLQEQCVEMDESEQSSPSLSSRQSSNRGSPSFTRAMLSLPRPLPLSAIENSL